MDFFVASFEDLVDNVRNIPIADQKDLAEDILRRFDQDGWDITWSSPDLHVSRTEEL